MSKTERLEVLQDWQYESEGRKKGPSVEKDEIIECRDDFAEKLISRGIAQKTKSRKKARIFPPPPDDGDAATPADGVDDSANADEDADNELDLNSDDSAGDAQSDDAGEGARGSGSHF